MSVFNPKKTVSPALIDCHGAATVNLSFEAACGLASSPADIVLILDRSCSMDSSQLCYAMQGANDLIAMIAGASSGNPDGNLGGGTRMGIVTFASTAVQNVPLTTQRNLLNAAVSGLTASGGTNHAAAFEAAQQMLGPKGSNRQMVIMFTDGITTEGGDAAAITGRMKSAGIEIYCIGLVKAPELLERWASMPLAGHVYCTSDASRLDDLFRLVGDQIIMAGARNIVIQETVAPNFRITSVTPPAAGTAQITGPQTIVWKIPNAGLGLNPETLSLSFGIIHTGSTGGVLSVNQSVIYRDDAGNTLHFPSPVIQVACPGTPIYPEPCPVPTTFVVPHCQDAVQVDMGDTVLASQGRIVQLNVTLKSICPGKRVAVSVILTETGPHCEQLNRGVKHILVPAHTADACQDVTLNCIQFSVPEALDACGCAGSICNPRSFQAQVIANYVDTDFVCCDDLDVEI